MESLIATGTMADGTLHGPNLRQVQKPSCALYVRVGGLWITGLNTKNAMDVMVRGGLKSNKKGELE